MDFISVRLDTDTRVVLDREEVVDDFEALRTGGVVGTADVHACAELGLGVVAKEGQCGDDGVWCNVECELVLDDAELLDELGETWRCDKVRRWIVGWFVHSYKD